MCLKEVVYMARNILGNNRLSPHRDERPMPKGTVTKIKESILMKNTPVEAGRFAFFSPLPMLLVTEFWALTLTFAIGLGVFKLQQPHINWLLIPSLLPLLFSPTLGVLGIIHGIRKRHEKKAWLGILLSALCLVENALMLYWIGYIGSRY